MKKIIIPILLGFALLAVSCEKNLEIPQKGVISTIEFYSSDADAQAALNNMYAQYIDQVCGTPGIYNPQQSILNYAADDILAAGKAFDDHYDFRVFDEFKYDSANGALKELYQRYCYAIYHANLVISNFTTENRNGTEPKWTSGVTEQCVAEARVMRAYLHMMTALIWNQPPLLDRIYEGDEFPVNDKTQEEILDWVVSECEKAIASGKLPVRSSIADKDNTARMNLGFAQFVAGKAALFNNKPEVARKYLGDLINSGKYKLVDSDLFWTNFHVSGDGNSEKIFEPNYINDPALTEVSWARWVSGLARDRWMVANVLNWRSDALLSQPPHRITDGWGGGAIQEDFAQKFLDHDGNSPRRLACFLTEDEFLYEMEWASDLNDGTLEQKKADPKRGLAAGGLFGHGKFFEWKHQVYVKTPKLLGHGTEYPRDNVPAVGDNSNEKNFLVARYAEALLLYAEACIGSSDEAKGLKALQDVQQRSGSGKISSSLTFQAVMEEKQYEMWFETCRFLDLIRWSKQGKVDLNQIYNTSGIHKNVPMCHDEYSEKGKDGFEKYHKFYTTHEPVPGNSDFVVGKHEYLPFPRDVKVANPHLKDVLGWAFLNDAAEEETTE